MRPTARWALLAIACGLVMAVILTGIMPRVLVRVAGRAARVAATAGEWAIVSARAEDMKFEPLPAESVSSLERRSARRIARTSATRSGLVPGAPPAPAKPETAAEPDPSVAPETPEPPTVVIGKSGDIMRVGTDIEVAKEDVVTGDVLAVAGDLTVKGHVEGNAVAMGGDIYLQPGARVDGDVVCVGGELHEEPGSIVGGKRVVGLGSKRMRASRALRSHDVDIDLDRDRHGDGRGIGRSLAWLLVWLLIGWTLVKLAPGRTVAALESFRRGPGTAFLVGWLAIVLTVPGLIAVALLTALLCITIIGIPLGIALLFAYFLFLAVFVVWGIVVGAAVVGERVAMRRGVASPTVMRAVITGTLVINGALVGAHVLKAMGFIPFFGGLGSFARVLLLIAGSLVSITGWGALLHSEFTTGLLARWWHGRRAGPFSTAGPAGAAGAASAPSAGGSGGIAVTTVAVPTATPVSAAPPAPLAPAPPPVAPSAPLPPAVPPSPPDAFMPPPGGSPPPTAGS